MPITNILKSAAIISLGAIVGYSAIKFFSPEQKNRFIASYPISKLGKEQNARYLFDVKINSDELALTDDGISTIKVNIEALKNFNSGLIYSWNLPQDIQLVEGNLSDNLGEFTANQSKEFILKVRGFSKNLKKFISFEVRGEFEQKPIHREVLISSRIEDSFEYVIQQNELNRQKNQINKLGADQPKSKFNPENVIR